MPSSEWGPVRRQFHRLILCRATEGQVVDEKAPSAGAKSLCIPFDQDRFGKLEPGTKCIGCGADAKRWTMFGRSEFMGGDVGVFANHVSRLLNVPLGPRKGLRHWIDESRHACNTGLLKRYNIHICIDHAITQFPSQDVYKPCPIHCPLSLSTLRPTVRRQIAHP